MNKLILATSMIGLALVTTQAEAGESERQSEQATMFILTQDLRGTWPLPRI